MRQGSFLTYGVNNHRVIYRKRFHQKKLKTVDDVTLNPLDKGQSLVCNATCSDTLIPSFLHLYSVSAVLVAKKAVNIKFG